MKELQKMPRSELERLVFIKHTDLPKENPNDREAIDVSTTNFYSIKKTEFKVMADNTSFINMQVMDITSRVRFQKLVGEKNLLQMINACVSHEMRNPINSIHCQNIKLQEAAKMLNDLLKSNDIKSVKKMRREMQSIVEDI